MSSASSCRPVAWLHHPRGQIQAEDSSRRPEQTQRDASCCLPPKVDRTVCNNKTSEVGRNLRAAEFRSSPCKNPIAAPFQVSSSSLKLQQPSRLSVTWP